MGDDQDWPKQYRKLAEDLQWSLSQINEPSVLQMIAFCHETKPLTRWEIFEKTNKRRAELGKAPLPMPTKPEFRCEKIKDERGQTVAERNAETGQDGGAGAKVEPVAPRPRSRKRGRRV